MIESISKTLITTQLNSTKLQEDTTKQLNTMKSQILTSKKFLGCSFKLEESKNSLSTSTTKKIKSYTLGWDSITSLLAICSRL